MPPRKRASTRAPLESAPLPDELVLPLEGGLSARDMRPAVQSGQRVLRGQPLVRGGGPLSTWTRAGLAGLGGAVFPTGIKLGAEEQLSVATVPTIYPAGGERELGRTADALPCIRCGDCVTACPAHLMPQELFRAVRSERFETLEDLGLFDCIECGCCDVVYPSHIRLTENFRAGKQAVVQTMDQQARVRWFDAREQLRRQRVEHWEAEHGLGIANEQSPARRAEAVAEVIERVSRLPESSEN